MAYEMLGCWEIDCQGRVSETDIPPSEPDQEELDCNFYLLSLTFRGRGAKRKVNDARISILNGIPRNPKAENRLRDRIRTTIHNNVAPDILEHSGGIEAVMELLQWEEFWATQGKLPVSSKRRRRRKGTQRSGYAVWLIYLISYSPLFYVYYVIGILTICVAPFWSFIFYCMQIGMMRAVFDEFDKFHDYSPAEGHRLAYLPFLNLTTFHRYCTALRQEAEKTGHPGLISPAFATLMVPLGLGFGYGWFQEKLNRYWKVV